LRYPLEVIPFILSGYENRLIVKIVTRYTEWSEMGFLKQRAGQTFLLLIQVRKEGTCKGCQNLPAYDT